MTGSDRNYIFVPSDFCPRQFNGYYRHSNSDTTETTALIPTKFCWERERENLLANSTNINCRLPFFGCSLARQGFPSILLAEVAEWEVCYLRLPCFMHAVTPNAVFADFRTVHLTPKTQLRRTRNTKLGPIKQPARKNEWTASTQYNSLVTSITRLYEGRSISSRTAAIKLQQ